MPFEIDQIEAPLARDDDEGLFSRDINGQLVRLDAPTADDYQKIITIQIDGQPISVRMAKPLTDAAGNIVLDQEGRSTPRFTTIYDAVAQLYEKEQGGEARIPIPILCHQSHMKPVAVCRMCVVQIYGQKRGQRAAERKLLPACQYLVKEGMEVFTIKDPGKDGDRVRNSVKVLTELLVTDHLKPVQDPKLARQLSPHDELGQLAKRLEVEKPRFDLDVLSGPPPQPPARAGRRTLDESSPVFIVNHSACILCERCIRACNDIVSHHVIGRTGKGNTAGISFDLNQPMGDSSCVKCGECMVSCPTSAITFKPTAPVKLSKINRSGRLVPVEELLNDPVFAGIPPKFLLWQQGLVVRRRFRKGQVLFEQGEPGHTAFIIRSGRLRATTMPYGPGGPQDIRHGVLRRLLTKPLVDVYLTSENLIVGEMACLSGSARTATLRGASSGEVWELRRNVLDRLMRLPSHKLRLEKEYRDRSLRQVLSRADVFRDIECDEFQKIGEFLQQRITFMQFVPGQPLFHQGDPADALFIVRLGHVKAGTRRFAGEIKVISRGPGSIIGEIALLGLTPNETDSSVEEVDRRIQVALDLNSADLSAAIPSGKRTATCTALDHVESARLGRMDFLELVRDFPIVRRRMIMESLDRLRSDRERNPMIKQYIDQGLYEGQSLLVMDMERCTRCDECVKACVQEHGTSSHGQPITRLLRDGLHFANLMIATACRSCTDAYCMIGCPVDSIHRGRHGQIVIEDHCIGCGLCASNCPYGNIFMAPNERGHKTVVESPETGRREKIAPLKASTCDLCDSAGSLSAPYPRCVAACPHDAAHRMTGSELLRLVTRDEIL
jgi:Fe-S-cluster-containing hydrogenase component 2/CRP-like cAMP-binding protein